MSAEWLIREAGRADAEAVAALYQETWPVHWHTADLVRTQFDIIEPIGGTMLVATAGGRTVGRCEFIPTREPQPYGFWGFLEALDVHRDFWRRGIGTALVEEAIHRCSELGCARFGTSPDDERSRRLYRKSGMTRLEEGVVTKFAVPGDVPEPDAEPVEKLAADARPWEELLHVLGRFSSLAYLWSVAFRRKELGEKAPESVFAERLLCMGRDVVVFYTDPWLHVLVPPPHAANSALLQQAVIHGVHRIKALGKDSFSTLMPFAVADAVRAVPGIYPSESRFHFHMWMPLREG